LAHPWKRGTSQKAENTSGEETGKIQKNTCRTQADKNIANAWRTEEEKKIGG
jgi:hypothetical protein